MAGEVPVHAAAVGRVVVVDRADDRELVRLTGQEGHVLADENARGGGGDRLKLAADFSRSIGFGVPSFVVTDAAPAIQNDAGLGLRLRRGARGGRGLEL